RRLQRRLAATGHVQVSDYLRYLQSHPAEYERLIASFLVKVTEFFRDPALFDALREQALPELIAFAREHGNELRVWSAGCATGEEAYSLAILFAEALREDPDRFNVQIFATDLDEEAVAFARRGLYPSASVAGLTPELLARYFTRTNGTYEVSKQLRGQIIFGQHDLGQRAPFPRIDLVLCRNVLIYFTPELQRRALQLFAFALRNGGYLALGKAETVKPLEAAFAPAHERLKLYRRQGERVLGPIIRLKETRDGLAGPPLYERPRRLNQRPVAGHPATQPVPVPATLPTAAQRARTRSEDLGNLVLELAAGVVVVDASYDIQFINSAALRLLGIYKAALGKDLIHLTTSMPATALREAIDAAFLAQSPFGSGSETVITVETVLSERRQLQISCLPRLAPEGPVDSPPRRARVTTVLILVSDVTGKIPEPPPAIDGATRQAHPDHTTRVQRADQESLTAQLAHVGAINRELLRANQELADTNMDLHGANEELLVGHEEAEATTEEVRTLNEELQATNEELVTLNEEMEATVEELHTANEDLQARSQELRQAVAGEATQRQSSEAERARLEAILLSMGDAVLVVDATGAPLLTNAAYTHLFGSLTEPIAAQDLDGHPLAPDAMPQQRAARGEVFLMEFVIAAPDGSNRYFEASGQPIHGTQEQEQEQEQEHGGVVTIRDITDRSLYRLQHQFMAQVGHELRTPLTAQYTVLQLLERRLPRHTDDQQMAHHVEMALDAARRMRKLIDDLLDMSRLRTGKFTLKLKPVDLVALARRSIESAQAMAAGQTIALDVPAETLLVLGDRMRIEQIMMNLLTNAIKYAPDTPRIDVRLRQVSGSAELQVHDTGMGIAAADLPRIFTRAFQSTLARDVAPSGLGLGLYLTREMVEAHGGTVVVESAVAQGSTFTVRLPLAPAH
ncbi:MAG TPA: CheR family methyltransferase, partial [Ktedonobacterales bacterium]|nr:CheR family methyltransferase [Ktedonobacterales bacterium]